jgi:lipase
MKRPVIALHAALAHGGAFGPLAAQLPQVDLHSPDFIGHGRAAPWDGFSDYHTACTRDAIAATAQLAASSGGAVDVIGHSFGATVALRMALERPELIRSLVLIEPVLFAAARADEAPEFRAYAAQHALVMALLDNGDVDDAAALFHKSWGDGRDYADLPRATRAYITHRMALISAQTGGVLGDSGGIMGYLRLESCPAPTLLLRGANSPPIIPAIHRALAARLPRARDVVIGGAGHMLPLTHPAECSAALQAFWASI